MVEGDGGRGRWLVEGDGGEGGDGGGRWWEREVVGRGR